MSATNATVRSYGQQETRQEARACLRHAQTFLAEATAMLSTTGLDELQEEASRLHDAVQGLDLDVQAA